MFGNKAYASTPPSPPSKTPMPIPPIFSSLSEAQSTMEYYGQLYRMTVDASDTEILDMQSNEKTGSAAAKHSEDIRQAFAERYINIVKQWTSAFDAFLESRAGSFTQAEMRTIHILRLHQLHNQVSVEVSTRHMSAEDQMFWDDYCPVYDQIIDLANAILAADGPSSSSSSRNPAFSLDLVTIGPIFELARRCRDPWIRRRAVDVMRRYHRREGMWDSEMALLIIERVIEIEEDGLVVQSCQDIPHWRRIFNIRHKLDMEARTIQLLYERQASATRPVTVQMQEIIAWKI